MSTGTPGDDEWIPSRVLAVYAHPDDPEVSCGGTLVRWARQGASVHLVVCTRGEKGSSDPGVDSATLAEIRAGEADDAATVMGLASHENLGYPDGELDNTVRLREQLVRRIRTIRPDALIFPDPTAVLFGNSYVNHRDHREIGFAMLDACSPASSNPLYFPDSGEPHRVGSIYLSGTLEPDTWVDITTTIETKIRALLCHRSQVGDAPGLVDDVLRHRAHSAGVEGGLEAAEGFRVLHLA